MGFHVGHRPGRFPDVVVDESLDHQAVWQRPEALPKRFYNYREKWNYPAFAPDGSAPASSDFDGVELDIAEQVTRRAIAGMAGMHQEPAAPRDLFPCSFGMPLRAGNLHFTWRICPSHGPIGSFRIPADRPVPFCWRRGSPGRNTPCAFRLGQSFPLVSWKRPGPTWWRPRPSSRATAHIPFWSPKRLNPSITLARITKPVQDGEPVIAEQLIGLEHEREIARWKRIRIAFRRYPADLLASSLGRNGRRNRIDRSRRNQAGLATRTQSLVAELCPEVYPNNPPTNSLATFRNPERWDRQLADKAGAVEMRKMNAWFQKQRPGVGEIIVEAHPGVFFREAQSPGVEP